MRWLVLVVALAACEPPGYGRHNVDAGGDGGHGDGAKSADAAVDGANTCTGTFSLDGQGGATTVYLTGDFVAWGGDPAHGATALALAGSTWTGMRDFAAGSYQYKFIVDGAWIPDPNNPNSVPDGFGGHNSVYVCMP